MRAVQPAQQLTYVRVFKSAQFSSSNKFRQEEADSAPGWVSLKVPNTEHAQASRFVGKKLNTEGSILMPHIIFWNLFQTFRLIYTCREWMLLLQDTLDGWLFTVGVLDNIYARYVRNNQKHFIESMTFLGSGRSQWNNWQREGGGQMHVRMYVVSMSK